MADWWSSICREEKIWCFPARIAKWEQFWQALIGEVRQVVHGLRKIRSAEFRKEGMLRVEFFSGVPALLGEFLVHTIRTIPACNFLYIAIYIIDTQQCLSTPHLATSPY